VKYTTFEPAVLGEYAMVAKHVGDEYATAHRDVDAAAWYRRALSIFPGFTDARAALERATQR
jgi:hypothetical protein